MIFCLLNYLWVHQNQSLQKDSVGYCLWSRTKTKVIYLDLGIWFWPIWNLKAFDLPGNILCCPCLGYCTAGSQWCISYLTAAAVSSVTFALLDHGTEGDGRPSPDIWQKLESFKSYILSEQQCGGLGHLIFNLLQKGSGKPEGSVKYTDLSTKQDGATSNGLN